MQRVLSPLALWLLTASIAFATNNPGLVNARRAQALLGADTWTQVISIENRGATSRYPRMVHALVFELAGILWFYTDTDGTQSLSTHAGRLEQDKADIGPLLLEIDRGFSQWKVLPADAAAYQTRPQRLRNGCFVESVANLRQRIAAGEEIRSPQLLSYYASSGTRLAGHTVLTYETAAGVQVIDPLDPAHPLLYPPQMAQSAAELGTALVGRVVKKAVWLPVGDFAAAIAARCVGLTRVVDLALR
jgi:hypothetical protein